MRTILLLLLTTWPCVSQVSYTEPPKESLPEQLQNLPRSIEVDQFPSTVHAFYDGTSYLWKHTTTFLSETSNITVKEYGAYLYYNDAWHLRRSYPLDQLMELFGIKDLTMMQGEPYVFKDNWRKDEKLFGGWALWYVMGETEDGELVCGYARVHTTDKVLNEKN